MIVKGKFKLPVKPSPPLVNDIVEPEDPLAAWEPGFSTKAAIGNVVQYCHMPDQPHDPHMPSDITQVTSDELGDLQGWFNAFIDYLDPQVALAEIAASEEEAYLEHVKASVLLLKAGTVQAKAAKAANDQKVIEVEMRYLTALAKAKLLKARLRGYEKCAAALSREQSRRQPRQPREE